MCEDEGGILKGAAGLLDLEPVRDPSMLFGREVLLNTIETHLSHGQTVTVVGIRKCGISSVLQVLAARSSGICLYFDTEGFSHLEAFVGAVAARLFDAARTVTSKGNKKRRAPPAQPETIIRKAIEALYEATGRKTTLILDHFERQAGVILDKRTVNFLRALVNAHRASLVTSYGGPTRLREETDYFNIGLKTRVDFLDADAALGLATARLAGPDGGDVSPAELRWVLRAGGRHPHFLTLACRAVLQQRVGTGPRVRVWNEDFLTSAVAQYHRYLRVLSSGQARELRAVATGELAEPCDIDVRAYCLREGGASRLFSESFQEFVLANVPETVTTSAGSRQPERSREVSPRPLVVSMHGIRTRGAWQKELTLELNAAGFDHEPLDYGFFRALRLLWPPARRRQVEWFRDRYTSILTANPGREISVIAHSLGSYLVARALELFPEITLTRLVLCGSIVRIDYPWSRLVELKQVEEVLNDFGPMDIWARAAGWVVEDAGPSGVRGFEDEAGGAVSQRRHAEFRHSDYFYALNYRKVWIPFLGGRGPGTLVVGDKRPVNWQFRTMTVILLLLAILAAGAITLRNLRRPPIYPGNHTTPDLELNAPAPVWRGIDSAYLDAQCRELCEFRSRDQFDALVRGARLALHESDATTVGITSYPTAMSITIEPGGNGLDFEQKQISIANAQLVSIRFDERAPRSEIHALGLTYQQGGYAARFKVVVSNGVVREFTGSGYFPSSGFFGVGSSATISELQIDTDPGGSFMTTDFAFASRLLHSRAFASPQATRLGRPAPR